MELFRWAILTGFVVSLVTFLLYFVTHSLGIRLIVAIVLSIASIVYYLKKEGVPESAASTGGIIALAAVTGLLTVISEYFLEYFLTLVLFAIAYGIGVLTARFVVPQHGERKKKRKEEPEEDKGEPMNEIPEGFKE